MKMIRAIIFACAASICIPLVASAEAPIVFEISPYANTQSNAYGGTSGSVALRIAERYTPAESIRVCAVRHRVRQSQSGNGIILKIFEGSTAPEAGTLRASASVAHEQVGGDLVDTRFALTECLNLTAGTNYWFVFAPTTLSFFGTTNSSYRIESESLLHAAYWEYQGFAFTGGAGWRENPLRQWSLVLEGPEPPPTPPRRQPLVIIPGILGSRLNRVSDGEEVWPNPSSLLLKIKDEFLDALILNDQGDGPETILPGDIVDSFFTHSVYGHLLDSFKEGGYAVGADLFIAPYDWRLDLATSIESLVEIVSKARLQSPDGTVTVIAHSMGGLLVKEYLRQNPTDHGVDKLVLAGVPELGSPKAFKALTYGDNFGFGFGPIDIFNSYRAKTISQNMPAVYQLLPSREYLAHERPYIVDYTSGEVKFLNYDESHEFMLRDLSDSRNPALLKRADEFHGLLDTESLPIPLENIYRIAGCQNPRTIGNIRVYPHNEFDIDPIDGDGTVPLASAAHTPAGHEYYALYSQIKVNHMDLISDPGMINLIRSIVTGEEPAIPSGVTTHKEECGLSDGGLSNQTTLAFSTHSPVYLHVYDGNGRHTGPNAEGDIELGIPESTYEVIGDNSFVWVPAGGEYRLEIDAFNSGEFDLRVKVIQGVTIESQQIYEDIPISSSSTSASLIVASAGEGGLLNLDEDGDGVADRDVAATYSLEGEAAGSFDLLPPASRPAEASLVTIDTIIEMIRHLSAEKKITEGLDLALIDQVTALTAENQSMLMERLVEYRSKCYITSSAYTELKNKIELLSFE